MVWPTVVAWLMVIGVWRTVVAWFMGPALFMIQIGVPGLGCPHPDDAGATVDGFPGISIAGGVPLVDLARVCCLSLVINLYLI